MIVVVLNYFFQAEDGIRDFLMCTEVRRVLFRSSTGREYKPFQYYGAPYADRIIIAMGSVTETIRETIDYLMEKGEKVGLIIVHLYRPFSPKYFLDVMPSTVKRIAVLDRTKEPGATGEPRYLDIKDVLYERENAPDRKSTRLNSSRIQKYRMPSSA